MFYGLQGHLGAGAIKYHPVVLGMIKVQDCRYQHVLGLFKLGYGQRVVKVLVRIVADSTNVLKKIFQPHELEAQAVQGYGGTVLELVYCLKIRLAKIKYRGQDQSY